MTTDREKIYALANALGDEIYETQLSFAFIPAWGKKFKFNESGEIVKVQTVSDKGTIKTISVDPEYETSERDDLLREIEELR